MIPNAVLTAANLCTATADCCQTTASVCALDIPITTNPPTSHCVPTTSVTCKATGAACNVDGDCCELASKGARCSGGTCTVPPTLSGYPDRAERDVRFQANCPTKGTGPTWQFLQSDEIIPLDSSISFAVQSASTQAGLTAAPVATTATWNATAAHQAQPPYFLADAPTVDQELRTLSPPSTSDLWLRVTVTLTPSTDHTATPVLTSLVPTYDCLFNQ